MQQSLVPDFKVKQQGAIPGTDPTPSGLWLLKVIIRESHIDTNATTSMIRLQLTQLDTYLPTVGHDILKFKAYVGMLVEGLASRGEKTHDLLANLFKGYAACSDTDFGFADTSRPSRTRTRKERPADL
mmetsp:Transcript_35132/g.52225  ORF Transcript_35132/g.52225 Transcript_35132/m.52225 type:complete len:128 (+) Transcript_35132:539-922(+)